MDFPETEPCNLVTSDFGFIDLDYLHLVVLAYHWHGAKSQDGVRLTTLRGYWSVPRSVA
jgi:hypothetical protein